MISRVAAAEDSKRDVYKRGCISIEKNREGEMLQNGAK